MTKEKIEVFLDAQKQNEYSAHRIEYTLWMAGEEDVRNLEKIFIEQGDYTEEQKEGEKEIEALTDPEQILRLMRKPIHMLYRFKLYEKMMEYQDAIYEKICRKILTTGQDYFTENATQFFLRCEKDPCEWILLNYEKVRSEYMKSMLCMVLGVRGGKNLVPFLILETARFQQTASGNETFSQGPICGVSILYDRFYRD